MKKVIAPQYQDKANEIAAMVKDFDAAGTLFVKGKRNVIRTFALGAITLNIKSFKVPNIINKLAYAFFRKSKARRSYEYAGILLEKGIGTPQPVAYFEHYGAMGLKDSYYVCHHVYPDLTFRELVSDPNYPDHENILRQFTRFSFQLHEKGIEFKDHSPGNTLIKQAGNGQYEFYLVDLNRMDFHANMSLEQRMENLKRLTPKKEMVAVMADEYARLSNIPETEVFNLLWQKTEMFQKKFHRKRDLKKKLGIGKK